MNQPLKATCEYLVRNDGEAGVALLRCGLDTGIPQIRELAWKSLLRCQSSAAGEEVLRRLPTIAEQGLVIPSEQQDHAGRLFGKAIAAREDAPPKAACEAVVASRLFGALPSLVRVLEDGTCRHGELLAQTMLGLAQGFYADLCALNDAVERRNRLGVRDWLTSQLEQAVRRFPQHGRMEAVEAFLIVVRRQNEFLKQVFDEPQGSMHGTFMEVINNSQHGGVIRLILSYLEATDPPVAVEQALSNRADGKFVEQLLVTVGEAPSMAARSVLRQIREVAWAKPRHPVFESLDDQAQQHALAFLTATGMPRADLFPVIEYLATHGKDGGRLAAARALAKYKGPQADALVWRLLSDDSPEVVATVVGQLRSRNYPDVVGQLIRITDGADPLVIKAIREALPEFSLRQYLLNLDGMPPQARQTAGKIVARLAEDAPKQLTAEMRGPSPQRRRRAVVAAASMGLAHELEPLLIELLLEDVEQMVRAAAAEALAGNPTTAAVEALRAALDDRSPAVQGAAEAALSACAQAAGRLVSTDSATS